MKNIILVIGILILLIPNSFGQSKSKKVKVSWGPEIKLSRRVTLNDIVGFDESGYYAILEKNPLLMGAYYSGGVASAYKTFTLAHFNTRMAPAGSVDMDLKSNGKKRNFEFIIYLDGKLYVFSSFKNQKLKKNFLFVQSLDKKTLLPANDLTKVAEIDYSRSLLKYNPGTFYYRLSNDKSKVLIYYSLPYKRGESERFGLYVFDNKLNPLWHKEVTLPFRDEFFEFDNYEVDNKGNVYLLGRVTQEKSKFLRQGKPDYKFLILGYNAENQNAKLYRVEVEGKTLTDMQIAINENEDIICSGFYSSGENFNIEGSYFLKINGRTKEIELNAFKEFGIDFITQNMTSKEERKAKRKAKKGKNTKLFQYDLGDIILKDDGGAVLVGEQYHVEYSQVSTGPSGGSRTISHYFYNDIIVVNISPEGKIEWVQKIPKRQETVNDFGFHSSYALAVVGDKLYFIFNDNPKNLYYKEGSMLYKFKKQKESLAIVVTLDRDGTQTRQALVSSREAGVLIRAKVCKQVSENEMILFGQKGGSQRFARAIFQD